MFVELLDSTVAGIAGGALAGFTWRACRDKLWPYINGRYPTGDCRLLHETAASEVNLFGDIRSHDVLDHVWYCKRYMLTEHPVANGFGAYEMVVIPAPTPAHRHVRHVRHTEYLCEHTFVDGVCTKCSTPLFKAVS